MVTHVISPFPLRGRLPLKPSNDRGFTLIEVLVAMLILTVALVSMAGLMAVTLRMQQLGRNQTQAVRLAQDKIDELMTLNFTNAQVAVGGLLTADVANHFDVPTLNGVPQPYRRRWTVALGPADPGVTGNNQVRVLTVRVIPIATDTRTTAVTEIMTLIRCWPC